MSLIADYPYLFNSDFLLEIDKMRIKTQYIKVTLLTWDEDVIEEIQSQTISGNLNLDGNSAIRRTANLSLFIPEQEADYVNAASQLSINKKIKLEIGIKNTLNKYIDYDILWFPLGIFVIAGISISQSLTGIDVNLSLKDKMCLLNGECGGILPASITFNEIETSSDIDGETKIEQPTIYQIIQELVNHWGGEQLGRILISDIENRIRQVVRWNGEESIYLGRMPSETGQGSYDYSLSYKEGYKEYIKGQDLGYIYTNFVYPGELIGNAGSTITEILDKIKNTLGNYEYFYDVEGNFHFQEIKNYLNTTESSVILQEINRTNIYSDKDNSIDSKSYSVNKGKGKSVYSFNDSQAVISYNNNPQYNNIKNDFIIWGMRTTLSGQKLPFRYHVAIDQKPKIPNEYYLVYLYEDSDGVPLATANQVLGTKYDTLKIINQIKNIQQTILPVATQLYSTVKIEIDEGLNKDLIPIKDYLTNITTTAITAIEETMKGLTYKSQFDEGWSTTITIIDGKSYEKEGALDLYRSALEEIIEAYKDNFGKITGLSDFPQISKDYIETTFINIDSILKSMPKLDAIKPTDWRTVLYLQGVESDLLGTDASYYYTELANEWRKLYDITGNPQGFRESVKACPTDIDFFLDFIDTQDGLNQYSVSNIGRRSKVVVDESINCMFEPEVNDIIFVNTDRNNAEGLTPEEQELECNNKGAEYCRLPDEVYNALILGGYYNGADVMMKDLLYQYTNFNESISLTCMPIYYLEPNTRITVHSTQAGISDDFIIQSISIPLDNNGTMTINANRASTKI